MSTNQTSSLQPPPPKPWWRRWYWLVARYLVLTYVGLSLVLYFLQSKMVYFPPREIDCTPAAMRLPFEEPNLVTADGVHLGAWFIPAKRSRGAAIFFHGNAENISGGLDIAAFLRQYGLDVLLVDYRGYGRSEGKPTEAGTYLDADAAWAYLTRTRGIDPNRIVVFGRSLGSAVAANLASRHPPGALVLQAAFTSIPDVGAEIYPYLPIRWLARIHYSTLGIVKDIHCPILVAHSLADTIIPYRHGRRIFEAANEPKVFVELTGDHNDDVYFPSSPLGPALREFLDKHLPPEANREPQNTQH